MDSSFASPSACVDAFENRLTDRVALKSLHPRAVISSVPTRALHPSHSRLIPLAVDEGAAGGFCWDCYQDDVSELLTLGKSDTVVKRK